MPPTGVGRRQQMFEVWIRPVTSKSNRTTASCSSRPCSRCGRPCARSSGWGAEGLTEAAVRGDPQVPVEVLPALRGDHLPTRLGYAVDDRFYGIEEGHLSRFRHMMEEVTREEVNAAIQKHLQVDNLVIAIVAERAAELRDALLSGAPSSIDYGGIPKPDAIHVEDREIGTFPLQIGAERLIIVPVEKMFQE